MELIEPVMDARFDNPLVPMSASPKQVNIPATEVSNQSFRVQSYEVSAFSLANATRILNKPENDVGHSLGLHTQETTKRFAINSVLTTDLGLNPEC